MVQCLDAPFVSKELEHKRYPGGGNKQSRASERKTVNGTENALRNTDEVDTVGWKGSYCT